MPKIVRMTSAEQREWGQNTPQLVNAQGIPQRAVPRNLESEAGKVLTRAQAQDKGVEQNVFWENSDGKRVRSRVVVKAKRLGANKGEVRFFTFIDGQMRVSTRDIMKARWFKRHGECQVRRPNGVFLVSVRDPKAKAPTVNGTRVGEVFTVPKWDTCVCQQWGGTQPGRHNVHCEFNSKAPPNERGYRVGDPPPDGAPMPEAPKELPPAPPKDAEAEAARIKLEKAGGHVSFPNEAEKAEPEPEEVPAPEDCQCATWPKPDKNKHAPICCFYERWEAKNRGRKFLVSTETNLAIREATTEEIGKADVEKTRSGFPIISINGEPCLVVDEKELPQLAPLASEAAEEEPAPETVRGGAEGDAVEMPDESEFESPEDEESPAAQPEPAPEPETDPDEGGLPLAGLEEF